MRNRTLAIPMSRDSKSHRQNIVNISIPNFVHGVTIENTVREHGWHEAKVTARSANKKSFRCHHQWGQWSDNHSDTLEGSSFENNRPFLSKVFDQSYKADRHARTHEHTQVVYQSVFGSTYFQPGVTTRRGRNNRWKISSTPFYERLAIQWK